MIFSNPRTEATFPDWPLGGNKYGQCNFYVEHKPSKGYRVCRVTTGKPKKSTYGGKVAIVDGDNGKTYILQHCGAWDAIKISSHDFMSAPESEIGGENYVSKDRDPRYDELMALIQQANQ